MSEETTEVKEEDCGCKKSGFFNDSVLFRLKQESTWRGIITVATVAGWHLTPDQAEVIITAGASLVAAINILKGD